jgi:hypothetical protein
MFTETCQLAQQNFDVELHLSSRKDRGLAEKNVTSYVTTNRITSTRDVMRTRGTEGGDVITHNARHSRCAR